MPSQGKEKRKRVRFCCFDMSTVNTPEYGELDSLKHCQAVCRLLVQSAKIGHKLFAVKSDSSWTRRTILMLIEELRRYTEMDGVTALRLKVARFVLQQFEDSYAHRQAYPWAERVRQHLSSIIRFTLKTIFNAKEFVGKTKANMLIPKWYHQIGTFSIMDEGGDQPLDGEIPEGAEFIPYHAAEITLNLQNLQLVKSVMATFQKPVDDVLDELEILDNPMVFFSEMRQVLDSANVAMVGGSKKSRRGRSSEFEKFLDSKWKELKQCIHDIQKSNCTELFYFIPLLDFGKFLKSVKIEL